MESVELERLERIAKNMIVDRLRMEQVEGKRGIIYLAHGLNADGTIIGLWGHRGVAHDFEFKPDTGLEDVRQFLMDHASGTIEEMVDRDLMDA